MLPKVDLKILPEGLASDPQRLDHFRREARVLASLNHPHIVTIHSIDEAEGIHFCLHFRGVFGFLHFRPDVPGTHRDDMFEGIGQIRNAELQPGAGFDVARVSPNFRPFVTKFEEVSNLQFAISNLQ